MTEDEKIEVLLRQLRDIPEVADMAEYAEHSLGKVFPDSRVESFVGSTVFDTGLKKGYVPDNMKEIAERELERLHNKTLRIARKKNLCAEIGKSIRELEELEKLEKK